MDQKTITLTLFGMMLVTYLPRVLPLWLFSTRRMPSLLGEWLEYVPVAVLAAMLFPSLLVVGGRLNVGLDNLFLWAALPTVVVAVKTRSFFGSVLAGVLTVALVRYLSSL